MYKLTENLIPHNIRCVERLSDNAFIPFDPANSDFQTFKLDIAEGVELQDAEGDVMTQEQVAEFLETLA